MAPVQLYVYDLSNGMARQMSLQLTGRQIDGIWHTSIVVFGKEIFYGQGISITGPGQSHHGRPLKVVELGETALDEQTFEEYLSEMREHYTADKYHLLEFNCNSFTNDCAGFLTGGSIPAWIKDLPSDFLSTPFGAALRPTIDAMYRRPAAVPPVAAPSLTQPNSQLTSALLQAVAERAASGASTSASSGTSTPSTNTVAAPVQISTNLASFESLLRSHRAVVAFFTSTTCAPCRMIEPVFEELSRSKNKGEGKISFVKIDIDVGMARAVAAKYNINATPTFIFFLDGKMTHELKGVNAPELRTQVDLLLYQAFPPHPHTTLELSVVKAISLDPILFSQVPALDTVRDKLISFIDASPSDALPNGTSIKDDLTYIIFPWLKSRFSQGKPSAQIPPTLTSKFTQIIVTLIKALSMNSLFPLLDIWRLAVLDPSFAIVSVRPLTSLLTTIATSGSSTSRATLLTLLRLLSNAIGSPSLARPLLVSDPQAKAAVTSVLVQTLLHEDRLVRVAAASVAFNVAAWVQRGRVARLTGSGTGKGDEAKENEEDEERDTEIISAVIESINKESESEEVVYRLTATLALFLRLSPFYEDQLLPLLEVLQARSVLQSKLNGEGGLKVHKQEVRALIQGVAEKLCV